MKINVFLALSEYSEYKCLQLLFIPQGQEANSCLIVAYLCYLFLTSFSDSFSIVALGKWHSQKSISENKCFVSKLNS